MVRRNRAWTAKERALIRQAYGTLARQPLPTRRIAELLGRKPADVRAAAQRFGVAIPWREWREPPPAHYRLSRLYRQGLHDLQIARALDCGLWVVFRWRKRNGLPANGTPGRKSRWLEIREQVFSLRAKGRTLREIAETVGVGHGTLERYLRLDRRRIA